MDIHTLPGQDCCLHIFSTAGSCLFRHAGKEGRQAPRKKTSFYWPKAIRTFQKHMWRISPAHGQEIMTPFGLAFLHVSFGLSVILFVSLRGGQHSGGSFFRLGSLKFLGCSCSSEPEGGGCHTFPYSLPHQFSFLRHSRSPCPCSDARMQDGFKGVPLSLCLPAVN